MIAWVRFNGMTVAFSGFSSVRGARALSNNRAVIIHSNKSSEACSYLVLRSALEDGYQIKISWKDDVCVS
jgi:hypothetical protein